MKTENDLFVYDEDFKAIADEKLQGSCVHLLCLEGWGSFYFNGFPFVVRKNDALVVSNPELLTDMTASDDLRVEYLVIDMGLIHRMLPPLHYGIGGTISLFGNPVIKLSETEASLLHEDIQHIRHRIDTDRMPFGENTRSALTLGMIYDLFSFHASRTTVTTIAESPGEIVKRFLELIDGGFPKTHRDVSFYAERLNVSQRYLSDTIKRLTGKSASQLIVKAAIPIITDMLKNRHLSISQISEELNFSTPSYFVRYCKKHLGKTPATYRSIILPLR